VVAEVGAGCPPVPLCAAVAAFCGTRLPLNWQWVVSGDGSEPERTVAQHVTWGAFNTTHWQAERMCRLTKPVRHAAAVPCA